MPRTPSGDVDLEAPPPRHANGRVDLQGVWMPNDNRYIRDLALDIGEAKVPYQPWARRLTDERKDGSHSREDPDAHCLPQGVPKIDYVSYPWKLVETPTSVVMMFETFTFWRQIFTDGRTRGPERQAGMDGLLDRPLGGRLARRRDHGLQRQALARPDRPPDDGSPARDGALHAHALRPHAHRRDDRRPGAYTAPWSASQVVHLRPAGSRSSSSAKRTTATSRTFPATRRWSASRTSRLRAARAI